MSMLSPAEWDLLQKQLVSLIESVGITYNSGDTSQITKAVKLLSVPPILESTYTNGLYSVTSNNELKVGDYFSFIGKDTNTAGVSISYNGVLKPILTSEGNSLPSSSIFKGSLITVFVAELENFTLASLRSSPYYTTDINFQVKAIEPTARLDGTPLQTGDTYFNSTTNSTYVYNATTQKWLLLVSSVSDVQSIIDSSVTSPYLLGLLSGALDESSLTQSLRDRIDLVDGTGNASVTARIALEAATTATNLAQETNNRSLAIANEAVVTASNLAQESLDRSAEILAEASSRNSAIINAVADEATARGSAIATESTARQTAETNIANNVTALEATVNGVNGVTATSQALSDLTTRTDTNDGLISTSATDILALESIVGNSTIGVSATSTALGLLDTRVVSAEGSIITSAQDIVALESTVNDPIKGVNVTSTALGSLTTRVTTNDGLISTNASDITNLESTVNDINTGVGATSTALSGLTTRVTTVEGDISTTAGNVTSLQTQVNTLSISDFNTATVYAINDLFKYLAIVYKVTSLQSQPNATPPDALYYIVTTNYASVADQVTANAGAIDAVNTRVDQTDLNVTATSNRITNLEASVNTIDGGIATAGALTALTSTVDNNKISTDSTATSLTQLTTTVDGDPNIAGSGLTASVQAQGVSINGLDAEYTVKVDVNGNVAGYGLASTGNLAGGATSEFTIIADKFSIAGVATDPNATDGSPFFHLTSPTVINGVTVPAGTYMKSATISDGSITNAKIGNVIQSNNYNSTTGWKIDKNGSSIFSNITIRDSNGNTLLTSGGTLGGVVQALGTTANWGAGTITGQPSTSQLYNNLLDTDSWVVGSAGSQGKFLKNSTADESTIILDTGAYGSSEKIWRCQSNSGDGMGADGGWDNRVYASDGYSPDKSYQFSVWARQSETSGTIYLGCDYCLNMSGTINNNPYFFSGDLPQNNKWYLIVGILHGRDYAGTTSTNTGGVYDPVTGNKVINTSEFKTNLTSMEQAHRTYLYYSNTTTNKVDFSRPRMEALDGNEKSIVSLLNTATVGADAATNLYGAITANKLTTFLSSAKIDTAHIKALAVDTAAIKDGAITSAKIGNAQITTAHIKDYIQSTTYNSTTGWNINKNGSAVFSNITIRDSSGTVLLSPTGATSGTLGTQITNAANTAQWANIVGQANAPASNATNNTGALADLNVVNTPELAPSSVTYLLTTYYVGEGSLNAVGTWQTTDTLAITSLGYPSQVSVTLSVAPSVYVDQGGYAWGNVKARILAGSAVIYETEYFNTGLQAGIAVLVKDFHTISINTSVTKLGAYVLSLQIFNSETGTTYFKQRAIQYLEVKR